MVEHEKTVLQKELNKALAVALTSDGWTSRSTDSYLTITCHFLKNWKLVSYRLTVSWQPQWGTCWTGTKICNAELAHIRQSECDQRGQCSNMTVAIRVSGVHLKRGCFAHILNLASNKALKVPTLSAVLVKVRSIVTFFIKAALELNI